MNDDHSVSPHPKPGDFLAATDALCVDEAKIVGYLLNIESGDGWGKANCFLARGFLIEEWAIFAEALRNHAKSNSVTSIRRDEWGIKYVIDCTIAAPNDDNHCIRVVWMYHEDDGVPRLITAHPLS